jgi:hypothetical protein
MIQCSSSFGSELEIFEYPSILIRIRIPFLKKIRYSNKNFDYYPNDPNISFQAFVIVRLSSRHYPVHPAAYPENVVPTQWKTQYTSRVAQYVLRSTSTKDILRTRIICQTQPVTHPHSHLGKNHTTVQK